MKHVFNKSSALLITVLIVSVISVVVLSISRNALQTLVSGTNITDWEIASQAAETGLENCIMSFLLPLSQEQLLNGEGVFPVGASLDSDTFRRRDMSNLALPFADVPLQTPPDNPTHQYWNCKVWQQTSDQDPVDNSSHYWKMTPQFDLVSPNAPLFSGHEADMLSWSLIDEVDQLENKYSVRIAFKPELPTGAGADYDTTLYYWIWADTKLTPDIDPISHCPKIGGTCMVGRTLPHSIADDPGDFFDQDLFFDELVNVSDPSTNIQNQYLHFYYFMDVSGISNLKKLTWSANFAKSGYTFKDDWYYIDSVGMYGVTRAKIRAMFDPYTKHFWRMPFK